MSDKTDDTRAIATDEVVALLESMADLPYLGEPVSQLEHSLQAGAAMRAAGGDDEAVLAAVLHDIGRAPALRTKGEPHEITGQRWCAEEISERAGYLVGAHVPAKRVLVLIDPAYNDQLSSTSVATLRTQGGPASQDEVDAFLAHPWAADALELRRADDAAKVPGGDALDMDEVVALLDAR